MPRAFRALVAPALLACALARPSFATILVTGIGNDDTNGIAGIDRGDPANGIPPDNCVVAKVFAKLQDALYAINHGLVADWDIVIQTNGPLLGRDPGVPAGVWPDIVVDNPVTIVAGAGFKPVIQGGVAVVSVRTSGRVLLKGLEVMGGGGVGVYGDRQLTAGPRLELEDMKIHDNAGGGVYLNAPGQLELRKSTIRDNGGPGIYANSGSPVTATEVLVSTNQGTGITVVDNGSLSLSDSQVLNNTGRGILLQGRTSGTVRRSTVAFNRADGLSILAGPASLAVSQSFLRSNQGYGVLVNERIDARLEDTEVTDSLWSGVYSFDASTVAASRLLVSGSGGAGVNLRGRTTGTLDQSTVTLNMGGGVAVRVSGPVTLSRLVVRDNRSVGVGAGVLVWDASTVTLRGSWIVVNKTDTSGAGIGVLSSSVTIGGPSPGDGNRIELNETFHGVGGGFACATGSTVTLRGNLFLGNLALSTESARPGQGGAVALLDGCPARALGNELQGNRAGTFGGGIAVFARDAALGGPAAGDRNVLVDNRVEDGNGGGIGVSGGRTLVQGNELRRNHAESPGPDRAGGGGLALVQDYRGRVLGNRFTGNHARVGGGLYAERSSPMVGGAGALGNFFRDNTARETAALGTSTASGLGAGLYLQGVADARVEGNTVVANHGDGIHLSTCSRVVLTGNHVGVDSGSPAPNEGHGVSLVFSSDNTLGPDNELAGNLGHGVSLGQLGSRNRVTRNSITGHPGEGIRLWFGGNREVPAPTFLTRLSTEVYGVTLSPAGSQVEVFTDPDGEGRTFVGSVAAAAGGAFRLAGNFANGGAEVTATVTEPDGSTSEFGRDTLDLDADSDNNNGFEAPDGNAAEDAAETAAPGKVLGVNDDDDGPPAGPDNANNIIDGPADLQDMGVLVLRRLSSLTRGTLTLSVTDQALVRIFDEGGAARIGPGLGASYDVPWASIRAGDLQYRMEGVSSGSVRVALAYKDPAGAEVGRDEVEVTVVALDIRNPTPRTLNPAGARVLATPAAAPGFNGNEFVYSAAAPGALTVPVRARIEPDTLELRRILAGGLVYAISPIEDSHTMLPGAAVRLAWAPGAFPLGVGAYLPASGLWESVAAFAGLPTRGANLGRKSVVGVLSLGGWALQARTAEFETFFPEMATNHPGAGTGVSPNWFFYWTQTSANTGAPTYSPVPGPGGLTTWAGGAWIVQLDPTTNIPYTAPAGGDDAGVRLTGIDTFGWTCRHEARHQADGAVWWPAGHVAARDADGDWIPDAVEPTVGPAAGGPYNPALFDTLAAGMSDANSSCIRTQAHWAVGSADAEDWASPGHQWGQ